MLKVQNISISYGGVKALTDASILIEESEIVTVIGSNGAGKTSLLKAISGLLTLVSGRIEFLEEKVDGQPPHEICKRGIIQVPEGRQLFQRMKVLHNLQMGAYLPEARKYLEDSLQQVYQLFPILKERKSQVAGLLSGGEQQMLAIGRAMMCKPRLLMLDEPSEGLAPVVTDQIFDILKILGEQGTTILLVSQEVARSLELSYRAYVLENGKVVMTGKSEELRNNDKVRESYLGI
ncbi:MAG: ABC transporter ATP-binding protein [Candidatus Thorarchaeota archaeon]|jgi:branched-chain amino acid transport system ATP-binding protein